VSYKVFKLRKRTTTLSTTVCRKIQATILSGVIFENGVAPALGEEKEDPAKYTLPFATRVFHPLSSFWPKLETTSCLKIELIINLNGVAFVSFLLQFFRNEW